MTLGMLSAQLYFSPDKYGRVVVILSRRGNETKVPEGLYMNSHGLQSMVKKELKGFWRDFCLFAKIMTKPIELKMQRMELATVKTISYRGLQSTANTRRTNQVTTDFSPRPIHEKLISYYGLQSVVKTTYK